MRRLANLGRVAFRLGLGVTLGLGLLETTLQLNPRLLIRGMAVPIPIDEPLIVSEYTVRQSEADLFFWHAALIQPIPPEADLVEAQVRYATDEFGFPNEAPAAGAAALTVIGRSYSLGAQAERSWPQRLAERTSGRVVNLSQAALGIGGKRDYWQRFGTPHHPRWLVVEVLPSMDILGYGPTPGSLIEQLPFPLMQTLARHVAADQVPSSAAGAIYPLVIDIGPRSVPLVFFSYYLSALSASQAMISHSTQWAAFQEELVLFKREAEAAGACLALVYAPTKEEVYVPLAVQPAQLRPALSAGWTQWQLEANGQLSQGGTPAESPAALQLTAGGARALVLDFAGRHGIVVADPTEAMRAAALAGDDPFMRYDSHWSATGHALVAQTVAASLAAATCP
jgi:hypothetical protein